jgi:hypothetical protein
MEDRLPSSGTDSNQDHATMSISSISGATTALSTLSSAKTAVSTSSVSNADGSVTTTTTNADGSTTQQTTVAAADPEQQKNGGHHGHHGHHDHPSQNTALGNLLDPKNASQQSSLLASQEQSQDPSQT